jgi:hypothetical protein
LGAALVCKRYKKVAFANTGEKEAIFTRLRCKQWDCPACAKLNQAQWRKWLVKRLPEVSDSWWLLTLTANENKRTATQSMACIRDNLDVFFKRLKRIMGHIEYVRVYEKHPTSEAIHAHVVICGIEPFIQFGCSEKLRPMAIGTTTRRGRDGSWAVRTWIKKTARALSMGYIADIKPLKGDVRFVALYITKYVTIKQAALHFKGLRHVQVTTGIGGLPEEKNLEWVTAAYITARMFDPNTSIKDVNTGDVIDNNHWELHSFYPHED